MMESWQNRTASRSNEQFEQPFQQSMRFLRVVEKFGLFLGLVEFHRAQQGASSVAAQRELTK
jgi:hypothetical protein